MATQTWAEGAWTGKWHTEQKEAWLNQIREVQVRGPAGAAMAHENPLFFWLRLQLFTVFPFSFHAVKACCVLQSCLHFFSRSLPLSCWTVFALASAINPSSNIAPAIANSSAFSFAIGDKNFPKCDTSFLPFFVWCAETCSTSTIMPLSVRPCNSSPNFYPYIGISSFWFDAFSFSSPKPINDSFVVDMHLEGSKSLFLSRQRKAVSSALLMVRWTSNPASIEPYVPCKGSNSSS